MAKGYEMFDKINKNDILIFDIESNALRNPDKVHVICTRTFAGETREFRQPLLDRKVYDDAVEYCSKYRFFAGHNAIQYDFLQVIDPLLTRLPIHRGSIVDTLVLSRLINYGRKGGHSIEAYGEAFGIKKQGVGIKNWDVLTDDMIERCHSDTAINLRVLESMWRFLEDPAWQRAIDVEMEIAYVTGEMTKNGFAFDIDAATKMKAEIEALVQPLDIAIQTAFPPRVIPIREVTPRTTKTGAFNLNDFRWFDGDDLTIFNGGPFTVINYEPFNPGSPKQIVERLNEAGWKPTEKTKGHINALKDRKTPKDKLDEYARLGWKVSEDNLKTLPDTAPQAAKDLGKRIVLQSRLSDLEEWIALAEPDNNGVCIRSQFNGIGAWTHRLSSAKPNLMNIPVAKRSDKDTEFEAMINDFNDGMRALFRARPGHRLIGTDGDGIQMRIFAHYVNDKELITALVQGRKEDKTDIHSVHQRKLGEACKNRDVAKTFIYAWLLGAGTGKVAEILEATFGKAKEAVNNFIDSYPLLKELKKTTIPRDAARGYFVGLDGRKVICDNEHLMLAGYLQNGEAVIMKGACLEWQSILDKERIPYRLVTWPHDEWQTEVPDDDDIVAFVQKVQIEAIRHQATRLSMNCPLEGTSDSGYTWKDTH